MYYHVYNIMKKTPLSTYVESTLLGADNKIQISKPINGGVFPAIFCPYKGLNKRVFFFRGLTNTCSSFSKQFVN